MYNALSPLCDDHDAGPAQQRRGTVGRSGHRSPATQAKAATKRTADDLPLHTFGSMSTTPNTRAVTGGASMFAMQTEPTAMRASYSEFPCRPTVQHARRPVTIYM